MRSINFNLKKTGITGWIILISAAIGIAAVVWSYSNGYIVAYGDSESHLNIAKRVIHSITPGIAQLGGIWLPLPHVLMIPFVAFDGHWRTGLAGSVDSFLAFILGAVYLYKLALLVTGNTGASFMAFAVYALNPNVLYMQTTPMTEMLLVSFFVISSYYFIRFLYDDREILSLISASFFAFCASATRYDGWFLVMIEASVIFLLYFRKGKWRELEGKFVLFSTLAFLGIFLWLTWNAMILGDPLYFTNSSFSAKSQQNAWYARGELPAFHNFPVAFQYYTVTMMRNAGFFVFGLFLMGLIAYGITARRHKLWVLLILLAPLLFNTITLYMGQSVIFIPDLTPSSFEWNLFNTRYGMLMVPSVAFFVGVLFSLRSGMLKGMILVFIALQVAFFATGRVPVITLEDGVRGLSAYKHPDAGNWSKKHYDRGLVLMDDYARTVSIIRSGIPMQSTIYIGNKPYWEESLRNPEKYARWIIMQKGDPVWNKLYDDPFMQRHVYKYYSKAYTSPNILIFKRNDTVAANAETR